MGIFRSTSYANVASTAALVIALGGTSYAAITITGANITDGTVTTADIKNNNLTTGDIKDATLRLRDFSSTAKAGLKGATGLPMAAGRPAGPAEGAAAPTGPPDQPGPPGATGASRRHRSDGPDRARWAPQGPAGVVTDGSVTTAKLAGGAVTASKIAYNAVGSLEVSDGSLRGADIAADTIAPRNLTPEARLMATNPAWMTWNDTYTGLVWDTWKEVAAVTVPAGDYLATFTANSTSAYDSSTDQTYGGCLLTAGPYGDQKNWVDNNVPSNKYNLTTVTMQTALTAAGATRVSVKCHGRNAGLTWKKLVVTKVDGLTVSVLP